MSTDAYLDAKTAFERIDAQLNETAQFVGTVAQAMSGSRGTFSLANTGVGLPAEAIMSSKSGTLNGDKWPSAKQIMEGLAEWHKAKLAMLNAWNAVPQDRRTGLVPPPGTGRGR